MKYKEQKGNKRNTKNSFAKAGEISLERSFWCYTKIFLGRTMSEDKFQARPEMGKEKDGLFAHLKGR
ncbi:MAG: hypothetical protein HUJ55_04645 [Ileibacterium sp.]|nr:hypothetical protein [Ileibacterium sp.]